jgi:hypothetical protein
MGSRLPPARAGSNQAFAGRRAVLGIGIGEDRLNASRCRNRLPIGEHVGHPFPRRRCRIRNCRFGGSAAAMAAGEVRDAHPPHVVARAVEDCYVVGHLRSYQTQPVAFAMARPVPIDSSRWRGTMVRTPDWTMLELVVLTRRRRLPKAAPHASRLRLRLELDPSAIVRMRRRSGGRAVPSRSYRCAWWSPTGCTAAPSSRGPRLGPQVHQGQGRTTRDKARIRDGALKVRLKCPVKLNAIRNRRRPLEYERACLIAGLVRKTNQRSIYSAAQERAR